MKTDTENVNLILSNSLISVGKNLTLDSNYEFNFNTDDFKIRNQTSLGKNLKIKYLIFNDLVSGKEKCCRCHKAPVHNHVGIQSLKILSVWDDGGYFEILSKIPAQNKEEINLLADIIEAMRKHFFHGKYVCSVPNCKVEEEFKVLKKEEEPTEALNDVQDMYKEQSKNQVRR